MGQHQDASRPAIRILLKRLDESGNLERIKQKLLVRLIRCGWRDVIKDRAGDAIRKRGVTEITVDELVSALIPYGVEAFPQKVKEETMENIKKIEEKAKRNTREECCGVAGRPASVGPLATDGIVVESVCHFLVESLCIDIACAMHRMVKTGIMTLSSIMAPTEVILQSDQREDGDLWLGPPASTSPQEISSKEKPAKRARTEERNADQLNSDNNPNKFNSLNPNSGMASTDLNAQQSGPVTRGAVYDIWGRVPPKEPRTTAQCTLCGRNVSALRFAPHLDKCMGVGSSRRQRQSH